MARKKLLTEGEVRQFMKLANLGPLSENYFSTNPLEEEFPGEEELEMGGPEGPVDELPPEDEVPVEDDLGGGDESEALLARVVQAVADELGVEVDVEGAEEGGEELEGPVDDLEGELGDEAEVDAAMMPGDDEEFPPGNRQAYQEGKAGDQGRGDVANKVPKGFVNEEEEELEERAPSAALSRKAGGTGGLGHEPRHRARGTVGDRPGEEEEEKKETGEKRRQVGETLDHDAIVAEVAKRVAERLTADKRKEVMAEQLAERIFERLTSK